MFGDGDGDSSRVKLGVFSSWPVRTAPLDGWSLGSGIGTTDSVGSFQGDWAAPLKMRFAHFKSGKTWKRWASINQHNTVVRNARVLQVGACLAFVLKQKPILISSSWCIHVVS